MDLMLPLGFQFTPTDIELIDHYLRKRKMAGAPINDIPAYLILECDVYATDPWRLQCDSFRYQDEEKNMHFFTHRRPKTRTSSRADRNAGRGYWHQSGKDNHIKKGSIIIGHKTQLNFVMKEGDRITRWIMHEYRLNSPSSCRAKRFDDLVLCRIHKTKGDKCVEEELDTGSTSPHAVTSDVEKNGAGASGRILAKRRQAEEHGFLAESGDEEVEGRWLLSKRRHIEEVEIISPPSMLTISGACYDNNPSYSASSISLSGVAAACSAPTVVQGERFVERWQIEEPKTSFPSLLSTSSSAYCDHIASSSASVGSLTQVTDNDEDDDTSLQELLAMVDFSDSQLSEDVFSDTFDMRSYNQ